MAKRFTLLDAPYFDALVRVVEAFDEEEEPIALVGGGASQAWIASLRTRGGQARLGDVPTLQTALRETRDLDFSTRLEAGRALSLLNGMAARLGAGAHVLGPTSMRIGPVSVALTLEPSHLAGMSDLYETFLEGRVVIELRRGAAAQTFPVIGLEHLLVTKLTRRGDKAKDLLDVAELLAAARLAGREIDFEALHTLLRDRPDALVLLDEMRMRSEAGGP